MAETKNRLNRKLVAYSAAAAAAIAVAPAASNAAIVYSGPQNINVNSGNSVSVDLDGAFGTDFYFFYSDFFYSGIYLSSYFQNGTGHVAESIHSDAARLTSGYAIGSSLPGANYWESGSMYQTLNTYFSNYSEGNFNFATGYIGVRFPTTCGTAYGWIHYQGYDDNGTVIDWAYEDVCGVPILAGETTVSLATNVPTMGEWGMLALAGLLSAAAISAINREKEETA